MKRDVLWKLLTLSTFGFILLANSAFIGSERVLMLQTVKNSANEIVMPQSVHKVIIKGMIFTPSELHVKKGDTVEWINEDIVAHNITDSPENKWTSGTLARGKSWKKVIDINIDYYCSIHPTMKGKIIVDTLSKKR